MTDRCPKRAVLFAAAHLKDLLDLPWQSFRWKRALESSRRLTFDATGWMDCLQGGVSYGNHTLNGRESRGPEKGTASDRSDQFDGYSSGCGG